MTMHPTSGSNRVTRRRLAAVGASLAGTSWFAACRASNRSDDEQAAPPKLATGITLQWASSGSGQQRVALHQQQAGMFESRFPGIKVELIPDGENLDKLTAGVAAGNPMDVVSMGTGYASFARQGVLTPLDPLIKRDKYDLKDFFAPILASWQWRNRQWAMPFSGVLTPYVNVGLSQESGTRQPPATWKDPTWTWNAFIDYCTKITKRDGSRTVQWGFSGPYDNPRLFMSWVWANGGDLFDRDFTRFTLGDPPALEALQFHADLMNKYRVMPHPSELKEFGNPVQLFQQGKVGSNVSPVGNIAPFRNVGALRWTVTALPWGAKGAVIGGGGTGWFLLAGAKHQDESWELLKFLESPESDTLQAMGGHAPPARRSVANTPEFLNPKEPPGADMKIIIESMESALHPDTILVQGDVIMKTVVDQLMPAWTGERSVRESIEVIRQQVEPLLPGERQ